MSVEEFGIKVVGILFLLLHYYSGRELASYLQQLNFLGQVSPGIKSGPGRIHGPRKNRWGTAWQGTIPPLLLSPPWLGVYSLTVLLPLMAGGQGQALP